MHFSKKTTICLLPTTDTFPIFPQSSTVFSKKIRKFAHYIKRQKHKIGTNFDILREQIRRSKDKDFQTSSDEMYNFVFSLPKDDVADIVMKIGVIPEDIAHDSSEEKLYSKTSDIIFAKALECIGLDVHVLRERSNAADIVARSIYHDYSMVGDAKAFRLSRTAKNAKDFKVDSMDRMEGQRRLRRSCLSLLPISNEKVTNIQRSVGL